MPHQRLSSRWSYAGNLVKNRLYLRLRTQRPMILDRKTVRLVLNPCNQFKSFRARIYGDLHIMIIQPSGAVVVILHHAADGNIQMQFVKHLQCNVDLSSAAIHQKQIRKFRKTSESVVHLPAVQIFFLLHAMNKTSGQHFLHAGIIIRTRHGLDAEFAVITALRLSLFKNHHGTHVCKAAYIGNIESFHAAYVLQLQKRRNLFHRADGSPFLPAYAFFVLA